MKKEDNFFLSSDKKTQIHYSVMTPDGNAIAIVQICHGMAEHIARYDDLACFFAEHGIVVCGCDHKGHGQSKGEGYGYFGKDGALDVLLEDQKILTNIMRGKYKHLPYVLFGHSMGSFVVRRYISETKGLINGAVICGTAGPGMPVGAGIALSKIVGCFMPQTKQCAFLGNIAFAGYNKRTGSDNPVAWLSREPKVWADYIDDPLCGFPLTPSGYEQMFQCIKKVNAPDWAEKVDKSLSILVTAGNADPVGAYGTGPQKVYEMLEDAEINDLSIKLYDGARHEIHNETNKDEVYADFLAFVRKVIDGVRSLYGTNEG